MKSIFLDTIAEFTSRKVAYLFGFVTLVMILIVWLSGEVEAEFSMQGGPGMEVGQFFGGFVVEMFSWLMTILVFLAVLATVGMVPSSLERGRAELLVSRPVSRTTILMSKLFSIWIVYGLAALMCGAIVYAITCAIHSVFDWHFIFLFLIYWLDFLIWLSIMGLAGVIFSSTGAAITTVFLGWIAQFALSYHEAISFWVSARSVQFVIDSLYYIFPKTGEIGEIAKQLAADQPVENWMPLWSSLLFAAAMIYLANVVFKKRDF